MTTFEKIYSLLAVSFACAFIWVMTAYPEYRQMRTLLPVSFLGLMINIGLMFIVFRDVYMRWSADPVQRTIWIAILLIFWPAILIYLPLHGFRQRPAATLPRPQE